MKLCMDAFIVEARHILLLLAQKQKRPAIVRDNFTNERAEKRRDYINFMAPTVIRQPESHRDLAAEGWRVRKRQQKGWASSRIIRTIPNKTTNLTNWWTGLTLRGSERTGTELERTKTAQNGSKVPL